jgi:hypothetical protein
MIGKERFATTTTTINRVKKLEKHEHVASFSTTPSMISTTPNKLTSNRYACMAIDTCIAKRHRTSVTFQG